MTAWTTLIAAGVGWFPAGYAALCLFGKLGMPVTSDEGRGAVLFLGYASLYLAVLMAMGRAATWVGSKTRPKVDRIPVARKVER